MLDGRFRIAEPMYQGGMGTIWKAADTATGETVAVKVLRLDAYTQGRFSPGERGRRKVELLKRFEREGAILEELDHPAIPRLLHRGYHREEPYLVMEYVDGCTLREFLDLRRPLPRGTATAIAVQVAEALSRAHAQGVVHRDLKPGNVVIAAEGSVKLLDFGIAYLTDPDATRYTALGATPGSAGYMAPEQLRGQQEVTAAVDLYAFGCVLFELLTGQAPFEDKPDRNKDIQHLEDLPPHIRSINAGLPQELDDLVWDLLGKAPADRPAGIHDALDVLRPHLPAPGDPVPEPALAPDPGARYRLPAMPTPQAARHSDPPIRRRSVHRRQGWLGRREFADLLARARAELAAHGPASQCAALAGALPRAAAEWGLRELLVADAQLVCADASRQDGEIQHALRLYEQAAAALGNLGDLPARERALEARLGIAECRIPEGDLPRALEGWVAVVREALSLAPVPAPLVERCHEVALELCERGCGAAVEPQLARLAHQ